MNSWDAAGSLNVDILKNYRYTRIAILPKKRKLINPLLQLEHILIDLKVSINYFFAKKGVIWFKGCIGVNCSHFIKIRVVITAIKSSWGAFEFCLWYLVAFVFKLF